MGIGKKYVLPIILGFVGMLICHFGLFLCSQAGIKFMAYVIVYPIVYPVLTIILTLADSRLWLSNAIYVCVVPFLYWYILLTADGRLNIRDFSLYESNGMSIIILFAFGISVLVAFALLKLKQTRKGAG